jgi:cell division protein FtsB
MEEATEEVPTELSKEVAEVLAKTIQGVDAKFAEFDAELKAFKKENETLKAEIETFKSSGKFGANPKKVEEQKQMTASEILKMKNK